MPVMVNDFTLTICFMLIFCNTLFMHCDFEIQFPALSKRTFFFQTYSLANYSCTIIKVSIGTYGLLCDSYLDIG